MRQASRLDPAIYDVVYGVYHILLNKESILFPAYGSRGILGAFLKTH